MAILAPADTFDDVFQLETTTPVKGGAIAGTLTSPTDGQANASLQALTNRTEYLFNRLFPIGGVIPFFGSTAPTGWLLCQGQSLSRTTYYELYEVIGTNSGTANGTSFNIPDLRGQFLRGYSGLSGIDPDAASRTADNAGGATGNNIGTQQADAFDAHDHGGGAHTHVVSGDALDDVGSGYLVGGGTFSADDGQDTTSSSGTIIASNGGNETRPTNIACNYIIRATL